jgi:hypothetical protein
MLKGKEMQTYFITDGTGYVKIGKAENTLTRLRQLQTGNPRQLRVALALPLGCEFLGNMKPGDWDESSLHQRFQRAHVRGEWFRLAGTIQQFITDMVAEGA